MDIKPLTKGQKTRDNIVEIGLKLFSENGYSKTSIQQIADICSLSQANIFYHFKTKKDLFIEILNLSVETNRRMYEQLNTRELDPLDRLIHLLKTNIEWCYFYPAQTQMIILLFNFAACDNDVKKIATERINTGRILIKEQLYELDKERKIENPIGIDHLAISLQQYINAVMFQMLVRDDKEQVYQQFNHCITDYLNFLLFAKN